MASHKAIKSGFTHAGLNRIRMDVEVNVTEPENHYPLITIFAAATLYPIAPVVR